MSTQYIFFKNPSVGRWLFLPLKFGQFQQKKTHKFGAYERNWTPLSHMRSVITTTPRLYCYWKSCKFMKQYIKSIINVQKAYKYHKKRSLPHREVELRTLACKSNVKTITPWNHYRTRCWIILRTPKSEQTQINRRTQVI